MTVIQRVSHGGSATKSPPNFWKNFHIRTFFGYEGYSYGTETKIFGEPKLPDGTLARIGRNEGVRKMVTAERKRDRRLAGLRNAHHEPHLNVFS